jgi:hypothetical protein
VADTRDIPAAGSPAPELLPNAQFVGRNGLGQVSILMPRTLMSRREALAHAAWLVAVADDNDEFPAYLAAVRRS